MMKISTSDIIDSIRTLSSSLKTLTGINPYLVNDEPFIISCKDNVIDFRVVKNFRHYKLSAWIVADYDEQAKCDIKSKLISNLKFSSLVGYGYYEDELMVCNIDGYCEYRSIVLEEIPDGELFSNWLEQESHSKNEKVELAEEFIRVANQLSESRLCIGNLKSSNLIITNNNEIKFANYRNIRFSNESNTDIQVLYIFAVVVLLSSNDIVSPEIDGSLNGMSELITSLKLATKRGAICEQLENRIINGLNNIDWHLIGELKDMVMLEHESKPEKILYDTIGNYCENVAVVEKDGYLGYIDRDGNLLTELKYTFAEDVFEGYAVVGIDSKLGVIHKSGRVVLSAEYDDILMPKCCRIVMARKGISWSIFDLSGEKIGKYKFDELLGCCSRAVPVARNGKWGIVNYHGELIIPCMYDEIEKLSEDELLLHIDDRIIKWISV